MCVCQHVTTRTQEKGPITTYAATDNSTHRAALQRALPVHNYIYQHTRLSWQQVRTSPVDPARSQVSRLGSAISLAAGATRALKTRRWLRFDPAPQCAWISVTCPTSVYWGTGPKNRWNAPSAESTCAICGVGVPSPCTSPCVSLSRSSTLCAAAWLQMAVASRFE
eukprot:scaffold48761_cov60-Phaeocystis_antarctica.AAC.3